MSGIWIRFRAELRTRWRAWLGLALLVGLPLGVAAGRWAWTIAADRLGVVAEPVVPLLALLALVPLTIVVANLVAAVPAWFAGRNRPAALLRDE